MRTTDHSPKTPVATTGLFALLSSLLCIAGIGVSAALPATAGAYATPEGPPIFSAAPGLPDGRVYEQVSPADKNGNEAGATTLTAVASGSVNHYGLGAADGNSVLFEGTGPIGESPWAASQWFVASKNKGAPGWSTRAALPAAQQSLVKLGGLILAKAEVLEPSPDLTHALVKVGNYTLAPISNEACGGQIYLAGPDPFVAAAWVERPAIEDPIVTCGGAGQAGAPVGGTPDFSTVYFTYPGTLLLEDAKRAPYATGEAWGFYEDHEGELREAGTLPADSPYPGKPSPFGAVPAASGHGRAIVGNQVSANGSEAFFVSPDPASCNGGHNDCATNPPELYVRESGERTLLLSKDTLLPEIEGLPGAAPDGVLPTPTSAGQSGNIQAIEAGVYVFASPDGSQAFFQSEDQLTPEAPSGNTSPKTYDFDVNTRTLTYLPGVTGQIVATDSDGSSFAFVRPEAGGAPAELDLWSAGSAGGSVTPITQLPGAPSSAGGGAPIEYVSEAQMANDGSALAFVTATRLSGAFNSGGVEQVYRYDVPAHTLGCVSCAPTGVTPADTWMSDLRVNETYETEAHLEEGNPVSMVNERGISADGDRIFFDSPAPLVPQDTNTSSPEVKCGLEGFCRQGDDVYEWENGVVYLISTGKSPRDSYLLDSSENGNDVFFATTEGLVPGDTDGGYDVYDARIPHPGDNPPAAAVPCEGAVCQGPPRVESPLAPPARATLPGSGNLGGGESNPSVTPPKKITTKTVKCKKNQVKKKRRCVVRHERGGKKGHRARKGSVRS